MKAEIYNHSQWIPGSDPEILMYYFWSTLKLANFTILEFIDHRFKPEGYTAIWLLAESHFALHTFPEHNKTYIELSSCSEEKYDILLKIIRHEYEQN